MMPELCSRREVWSGARAVWFLVNGLRYRHHKRLNSLYILIHVAKCRSSRYIYKSLFLAVLYDSIPFYSEITANL